MRVHLQRPLFVTLELLDHIQVQPFGQCLAQGPLELCLELNVAYPLDTEGAVQLVGLVGFSRRRCEGLSEKL